MSTPPKIIYSVWLQGRARAPGIVRLCFDRWARFNPEYEIRILDANDVADLLAGSKMAIAAMPPAALSDVVRARLLVETGGIWVDASLFPMRPLDAWLPETVAATGFFAFERPAEDRPLSSWFLAAAPGHVVMRRWWQEIERFWSRPRRPAGGPGRLPRDPVGSVAPNGGGAGDGFPYYWFHYLFRYMVEEDPDIAAIWQLCAKHSAGPPHLLQEVARSPSCSHQELAAAAYTAPVQKLDWRMMYPLSSLSDL